MREAGRELGREARIHQPQRRIRRQQKGSKHTVCIRQDGGAKWTSLMDSAGHSDRMSRRAGGVSGGQEGRSWSRCKFRSGSGGDRWRRSGSTGTSAPARCFKIGSRARGRGRCRKEESLQRHDETARLPLPLRLEPSKWQGRASTRTHEHPRARSQASSLLRRGTSRCFMSASSCTSPGTLDDSCTAHPWTRARPAPGCRLCHCNTAGDLLPEQNACRRQCTREPHRCRQSADDRARAGNRNESGAQTRGLIGLWTSIFGRRSRFLLAQALRCTPIPHALHTCPWSSHTSEAHRQSWLLSRSHCGCWICRRIEATVRETSPLDSTTSHA